MLSPPSIVAATLLCAGVLFAPLVHAQITPYADGVDDRMTRIHCEDALERNSKAIGS